MFGHFAVMNAELVALQTAMEYNGLYINVKQAYEDKAMLEEELRVIDVAAINKKRQN